MLLLEKITAYVYKIYLNEYISKIASIYSLEKIALSLFNYYPMALFVLFFKRNIPDIGKSYYHISGIRKFVTNAR